MKSFKSSLYLGRSPCDVIINSVVNFIGGTVITKSDVRPAKVLEMLIGQQGLSTDISCFKRGVGFSSRLNTLKN